VYSNGMPEEIVNILLRVHEHFTCRSRFNLTATINRYYYIIHCKRVIEAYTEGKGYGTKNLQSMYIRANGSRW